MHFAEFYRLNDAILQASGYDRHADASRRHGKIWPRSEEFLVTLQRSVNYQRVILFTIVSTPRELLL